MEERTSKKYRTLVSNRLNSSRRASPHECWRGLVAVVQVGIGRTCLALIIATSSDLFPSYIPTTSRHDRCKLSTDHLLQAVCGPSRHHAQWKIRPRGSTLKPLTGQSCRAQRIRPRRYRGAKRISRLTGKWYRPAATAASTHYCKEAQTAGLSARAQSSAARSYEFPLAYISTPKWLPAGQGNNVCAIIIAKIIVASWLFPLNRALIDLEATPDGPASPVFANVGDKPVPRGRTSVFRRIQGILPPSSSANYIATL